MQIGKYLKAFLVMVRDTKVKLLETWTDKEKATANYDMALVAKEMGYMKRNGDKYELTDEGKHWL